MLNLDFKVTVFFNVKYFYGGEICMLKVGIECHLQWWWCLLPGPVRMWSYCSSPYVLLVL